MAFDFHRSKKREKHLDASRAAGILYRQKAIQYFVGLMLALLLPHAVDGQLAITGRVTDAATGAPLPETEVFDRSSEKVALTNAEGYFELKNLAPGKHALVVYSFRYAAFRLTVDLRSDTSLQVALQPLSETLSEVEVLAKREELFRMSRLREVEGTAIYAGKKSEVVLLENTVGNLAANNARQVYAQVVGLNIYENNDAGLQLNIGGRGLDPNRTSNFNVRQNGYDISADVLGYPESYYTPTAEGLREIQVVRGAASLQYGTQFGGMLNFKMKQPVKNKPFEFQSRNTAGSFGLFTSFNSVSGTVGKFSYYTYFNYREGKGWRPNSAFNARNFYSHLAYDFNEATELAFEYTLLNYLAQQPGGLTDSQFKHRPRYSNRARNWFQVDWQLYALKLKHKISPKSDFSLNLFGLNAERNALGFRGNPANRNSNPITEPDEQDAQGNYINPRDFIKNEFNNWGAEARYLTRYKLAGRNSVFLVGTKYYQAANTSRQGPGSTGLGPDFTFANNRFPDYANQSAFDFPNVNGALFSENIFYLSDKFTLTPGIRLEYIKTGSQGQYQQVNFDNAGNPIFRDTLSDNRQLVRGFVLFGLGAAYRKSSNLEYYANFSQNYRSVTFSDIRTVNPTFVIDPEISDEKGFTADAGLRGKWQDQLSYDISAFSLLYDNRIGIILNNRAQRVRKNIGTALIYGLELFGDWNVLKTTALPAKDYRLTAFANVAYTRSVYLSSQENNVTGNRVEFIPELNLKTGINAGYKNVLLSLQYTYLSQQFTDVENSGVPGQGDLRQGIIGPIPAYGVMDISASYSYKNLSLEAGCNNVLNEIYFTRRATGYPGPGIIPSNPRSFYVTLGVKI